MDKKSRKLAPVAVAHELWAFILRPRQVVAARKTSWNEPTSAWSSLGWCSAAIIAVWGVYGLLFGSLVANLSSLGGDAPPVQQVAQDESVADPIELAGWRFTWAIGAGITLPQALEKPASVPQKAQFRFGLIVAELDNVTPSSASSTSSTSFFSR
jgi:hypothetical protein